MMALPGRCRPAMARGPWSPPPMSDIVYTVRRIVADQLGIDASKVTPESSFLDDLGADSLDTVEMAMAFEEAFDVEFTEEAANKIKTVKDAIDYIDIQKAVTA
jgi:acyl carrier protein